MPKPIPLDITQIKYDIEQQIKLSLGMTTYKTAGYIQQEETRHAIRKYVKDKTGQDCTITESPDNPAKLIITITYLDFVQNTIKVQ